MKRIAVITGASSGMGRRFAETCNEMGTFDEIWAIARSRDKLEALKQTAPFPLRVLAMDLTDRGSLAVYAAALQEEPVEVKLLVNAAGFGKFRAVTDTPLDVNLNMVDLNCQALQALCQLTLPYMPRGSHIINIASVAAYQPIPYIDVYGASKAFVLSYSRALNRELKGRGVTVTAVCPFWTRTAFFDRAIDPDKEPVVKKYDAMYDPRDVVAQAWRDAQKGRDMSRFGAVARFNGILAKLLPHSFVMSYWMRQQKLE
ncbi:MAG: SDR family NAD(P)-dependent oxidoreductase [Clostridia bacterium]|nr:SDR family NAD(P)-dependent oxidoreductase [Clostridia bacterium]